MNASRSQESLVVVEHLTKRFRQGPTVVQALREVGLTIEEGEFVAVMGASGSGKSTLLHAMAGLTKIDEGQITIASQNLGNLSDYELTKFRRQHIGLVFQSFNLIPSLTAEENILLPLRAAGEGRGDDGRLEMLFDVLKLRDRRQHRPDALSGGEQQRVAIARALITEPSLVLADEPTGSLDSITGQSICRLLRKLNDEMKRTIVVVTHEPSVAVWSDRVVVLKDGQVITQFKTADFADPQSLAAHYQDLNSSTAEASEVAV